jgi:hypothetical protein
MLRYRSEVSSVFRAPALRSGLSASENAEINLGAESQESCPRRRRYP